MDVRETRNSLKIPDDNEGKRALKDKLRDWCRKNFHVRPRTISLPAPTNKEDLKRLANLLNSDTNKDVISEIRPMLVSRDITIIQIVHSNVVNALLKFLTKAGPDREFRNRLFVKEFRLNIPSSNAEAASNLLALVKKLNGCVNQLEDFPSRVPDLDSRVPKPRHRAVTVVKNVVTI